MGLASWYAAGPAQTTRAVGTRLAFRHAERGHVLTCAAPPSVDLVPPKQRPAVFGKSTHPMADPLARRRETVEPVTETLRHCWQRRQVQSDGSRNTTASA